MFKNTRKNQTIVFSLLVVLLAQLMTLQANADVVPLERIHQKFFNGSRPLPPGLRELFQITRFQSLSYFKKYATRHSFLLKNPPSGRPSHDSIPSNDDKILDVYEADELIPESIKKSPLKTIQNKLTCWRIFAAGLPLDENPSENWCKEKKSEAFSEVSKMKKLNLDPVLVGRYLSAKYGKVLGREALYEYAGSFDESDSYLQNRFYSTVKSGSKSLYDDSLFSLSDSEKENTTVVFLPGYGNGGDRYGKMLEAMSKKLAVREKNGGNFKTVFVKTKSKQGTDVNNPIILSALSKALDSSERVIIVSISKGTSDLLQALLSNEYFNFSESKRAKIKTVISLAGVARISHVSWYVAESGTLKAKILGVIHKLQMPRNERSLNGMHSLAIDPLNLEDLSVLREALPGATWITGMAFPEGPFGQVAREALFMKSDKLYPDKNYLTGPVDGVMESMSSLLPHGSGIPQWVVRVYGSHQSFDGYFAEDWSPVSRYYRVGMQDAEYIAPGYDLLENYFRSIPAKLVR